MPTSAAPVKEATIIRTFDASLKSVWNAWTDPKQVAKWWGPKEFTNPVCEWDAVPGNKIHVDMTDPAGNTYPMGGEFHEVIENEKLVFTSIALEKGEPVIEALNTVTFTEKNGKTTVTIQISVMKVTGMGETYIQGMNEGWNQSLDKLADIL